MACNVKNMKTNIKRKSLFTNKNGQDMCHAAYAGLILENMFFQKPLSEI